MTIAPSIGVTVLAALLICLGYELYSLMRLYRQLRDRRSITLSGWLTRPLIHAIQKRLALSQRKRQRLVRMMGLVRQLGRAIPEALVVIDRDDQIVWSNQRAIDLLGVSRRDRGVPIAQKLSNNLRDWFDAGANGVLVDASAVIENVKLWCKLAPLSNGARVLIARDATAVARAAQVRRDFVANVSHELRTPLTVINGYLDAIETDELPDYAGPIEQMRKQGQRMAQIVEDLLTLARLEREEPQATQERVHEDFILIEPLIQQLQLEAERLSDGRHQLRVDQSLALNVIGIERDLRSAFTNLISNAVRYTPAGGEITISWRWHAEGAQFEVSDTGQGIAAEHLPRLTERFYRVSTSRSRESGGTGLGLAIVNHVLIAHGGRLEISSELGKGSRFCCILPRERLRALVD
jgi:two-component system, OmpR family, phosphate regulon sensor histidine kinase PhoR